jgi:hypothetical protein
VKTTIDDNASAESEMTSTDASDWTGPEVSVVMPCLNEAETLGICIREAMAAFEESGIDGEVVIADNGSTDGSQSIARSLGARVVNIDKKGYGNALMGGIAGARGRYVIMGDSDASYDFGHTPRFVRTLRQGYDLVMGNRFLGGIEPGAMPWKHRWIGNPVLSGIARLFFGCPAHDLHCGLRGFSKTAYAKMDLSTPGMEFASEMVIKSTLIGLEITEIPTVLRPDGRSRPPHLRSWRDGWRHLRFMLLFSPRWLFMIPGAALVTVGLVLMVVLAAYGTFWIGPVGLSVNTMLAAGTMVLVGYQILIAGTFARALSSILGPHPRNRFLDHWQKRLTMEQGVIFGTILSGVGMVLFGRAAIVWQTTGFGELNPELTVQQVVPAVVLIGVGVQTIFSSFFLSLLSYIPHRLNRI